MSNVKLISGSAYKTVVTVPWAAGNEWLLAGTQGAKIGNPQSGYAIIPLLYRAVKLRVDSLARVPFYIYQNDKEVDAWPFEGSLKLKEFIRKTELAMMLRGGSFTVKLREESGIQVGLQWLNPFFVVVWLDGLTYMFSYSIAGQTVPLQNRQWSQDDMIYWREFNPVNDIQPGVAPAQVALMDAQVSFSVSQFLEQFFAIGAMPATLVVVPEGTGEEEKAELESWFSRKVMGLKNAWKAIALRGEVKIEKLTPELKTFEIEKLDNHSIEAVCNAFDIPQTILRTGSANRATAETEYANYLQHTIIPRASWYEEQINDILDEDGQGYRVEFAPNELPEMQEDEGKRSTSFKNYVDAGIPIPVAAEIVKVPIPDAYRNQLMKGEPRNPIEMIEPEVKAELERYQRKAMKSVAEGRSAQVEFKTGIIPEITMNRLAFLLSDATSAHDVRSIFNAISQHANGQTAIKSSGERTQSIAPGLNLVVKGEISEIEGLVGRFDGSVETMKALIEQVAEGQKADREKIAALEQQYLKSFDTMSDRQKALMQQLMTEVAEKIRASEESVKTNIDQHREELSETVTEIKASEKSMAEGINAVAGVLAGELVGAVKSNAEGSTATMLQVIGDKIDQLSQLLTRKRKLVVTKRDPNGDIKEATTT